MRFEAVSLVVEIASEKGKDKDVERKFFSRSGLCDFER
jgi:Uma2 family endonuclease